MPIYFSMNSQRETTMIMNHVSEIIIEREFTLFLDEVCMNELEIVEELVADIHDDGQKLVNDVLSNYESKDFRSLLRAAHSLKSSTKIFGAGIVSAQAGIIEELLHGKEEIDESALAGSLISLQDNFNIFLAELDKLVLTV